MNRLYNIIILLFSSIIFSDEITLTSDSAPFVVDTQYPEVEWVAPDGGEEFEEGETINLLWSAEDASLSAESVSIYFSIDISSSYDIIFSADRGNKWNTALYFEFLLP